MSEPLPANFPRTLAGVLEHHAALRPHHPAVMCDGRTVTYGELRDTARAVARSLLALGVRPGERVGALLGNHAEWPAMALGTAYVGAVFVPLNTWYKRAELEWTLRHCGVSCLVATERFLKQDFAAMLAQMLPGLERGGAGALRIDGFPSLRTVAIVGRPVPGALDWDGFLALGGGRPEAEVDAALARVGAGDLAYILYTSGSTADPKGVTLAHGGVVANGWDMAVRRRVDGDDRVWIGSPLFYGLGATNAWPVALSRGATVVLQGAFDAGRAIETFERTRATVYYGTGNMTLAILDHPSYSKAKVGSLKKGNAGISAEYKRLTLVEMGMTLACGAYGLTESYGQAAVHDADDPVDVKIATCGPPLPGMELAIVDPASGAPLPAGEVGLVLLRGHVTPGYYRNDEENRRTLRADGWFDTGDLGSLNADGHFLFHSRIKEVIKTGGINVSPIEVEALLGTHPDIRDAHVVGVPDPRRGQLIVAFVDARAALTEQAVREYVRERAASFKVPHHVLFRAAEGLPRLASGKVGRVQLVEDAIRALGSG
jgi:fatty-acyl-CoA synthase